MVLEEDAGPDVHVTRVIAAVGRVAIVLESTAAPEIDRAALDAGLSRMAAFLADPLKARAEWERSPAQFLAHGRTVTIEVEGPDGEAVPRMMAEVWSVNGVPHRLEVREGRGHVVLPVRLRAFLSLWGAEDEGGTPLPFAPVETLEVDPEASVLPVQLTAGSVLHGDVTDYDARPLAGVVVAAVRPAVWAPGPLADLGVVYGRATSGPDGRFRIVGLGFGPYRLLAYDGAAERPIAEDAFVTPPHESHVQVPRGTGPIVTVVDWTGRPVLGARVLVRKPYFEFARGAAAQADALTDAQGRVRVFLPPHDFFALEVTPPAGSDLDEPEPVLDWRPAPLRIELGEGAVVRGVVVDDSGTPVRGVVFRRTARGFVSHYTGNDGKFRFRGVGPGTVRLLALASFGAQEPPAGAAADAWTDVPRGGRDGVVIRAWVPRATPSPK
jgi:hypothetical protein